MAASDGEAGGGEAEAVDGEVGAGHGDAGPRCEK